jgi:hypothetical protein
VPSLTSSIDYIDDFFYSKHFLIEVCIFDDFFYSKHFFCMHLSSCFTLFTYRLNWKQFVTINDVKFCTMYELLRRSIFGSQQTVYCIAVYGTLSSR